jgi:hypothetical protein
VSWNSRLRRSLKYKTRETIARPRETIVARLLTIASHSIQFAGILINVHTFVSFCHCRVERKAGTIHRVKQWQTTLAILTALSASITLAADQPADSSALPVAARIAIGSEVDAVIGDKRVKILKPENFIDYASLPEKAREVISSAVRQSSVSSRLMRTKNLSKAGWSWGCVSALHSRGRMIVVADAHHGDGKRLVVRADEKLTAFLELERIAHGRQPIQAVSVL